MASTVFVLRHGKSDWNAAYGGDHERPLKRRGREAAQRMGRFLSATGETPDEVLASSAVRARTTAELALEAGAWDAELRVLPELYETSPESILHLLHTLDPGLDRVLLVGHEPWCSDLVGELFGGPPPSFPTAALARLDLHVESWSEVDAGCASLAWLVTPRSLEAFERGEP